MKAYCVFFALMLTFFIVSSAFGDDEGLIGYWSFDEGSGDVAEDSSGNGNDGNLVRDPEWVDGKYGKALKFTATQRHKVEIPHFPLAESPRASGFPG